MKGIRVRFFAEGGRLPPRENIDGVPHQCSRADSRLLRGISTGECAVALTTLSPALPNRFLQLPWWEGCTLDEWRSWRVLACVRRVQRAWQVPKAAKPHPTDDLLGDGLMGCFTPLSKVMGGTMQSVSDLSVP